MSFGTLSWMRTPSPGSQLAETGLPQDSYTGELPAPPCGPPSCVPPPAPAEVAAPASPPGATLSPSLVARGSVSAPVTLTILEEVDEVCPWVDHGSYRERFLPAEPGQIAWKECQHSGQPSFLHRRIPAQDSGPAWEEYEFPGRLRASFRQRTVAACDGGTAWAEYVDALGVVSKTRTVPASDGGPDWTEREENGSLSASRRVASDDGKADWVEQRCSNSHWRSRRYEENGVAWEEAVRGGIRWRYHEGRTEKLARESASQGTTKLLLDGAEFRIHGAASPLQVEYLKAALEAMPEQARAYAREICLADQLGEILDSNGSPKSGIGGLAGDDCIALLRGSLTSFFSTQRLLYHEAGHRAEKALGLLEAESGWGNGTSVTQYGRTNAIEDFAECHRVVLMDFPVYRAKSASEWACESEARKKMQIVQLYGGTVPTWAEVQAAETAESRAARSAMENANARTSGRESGRVYPSTDGGDPWVDHLEGDRLVDRRRRAPAQDGGPEWNQFQDLDGKVRSEREVAAHDGGNAWTEHQLEGIPSYFVRKVAADDGGPDWCELKTNLSCSLSRVRLQNGQTWRETLQDGQLCRTPITLLKGPD